jgi:sulfur-carrier protein adenylyltransferase/sulfurtransferase
MLTHSLTQPELIRYSRQLLLPEIGIDGQQKLKDSSVLLIGAGGLGSPLALYLAAAGVGRIGIVDFDTVDESNLHRQVIHAAGDVGRAKVRSASERLKEVNPHVEVIPFEARLTRQNALDIFSGFDIVADGTDNFPTRYLVNDACVLTGIPNVYASIYRFDGQVSVFATRNGPCYRCLFPKPPPPELVPSCAEAGVLGVLPGTVGTLQATEVLKQLLGIGQPLVGRMLLFDALSMRFDTMEFHADPACPVCGREPSIDRLIDYDQFCRPPGPAASGTIPRISVQDLRRRMEQGEPPLLLDVRTPLEAHISTLGGLLIPLDELEGRLEELRNRSSREIIVYCQTGDRSATAVGLLQAKGFSGALNLVGGILAWHKEIDPTVTVH